MMIFVDESFDRSVPTFYLGWLLWATQSLSLLFSFSLALNELNIKQAFLSKIPSKGDSMRRE
jgi:hypothetical protein